MVFLGGADFIRQIDSLGKDLYLLASAPYVITLPNGRKINLSGRINFFKIFRSVVGEKETEAIARKNCKDNNIDYNNIAFNGNTKARIQASLASESNKS